MRPAIPGGDTVHVANTHKGQTEFWGWIGNIKAIAQVVLESTGPYHRILEERLAELVAVRRSLMRDRMAMLNRLKNLTISLLQRHARHRLRPIEAQITALDATTDALVAEDAHLFLFRNVPASILELGTVSTHAHLADMPELSTMEDGQAASQTGMAPTTR